MSDTAKHTNRLIHESSPYLLQHAHNPVDWYAWGPEAFDAARSQNKPIFLSVGYSTCYWCHVMERQSFENVAIAQVMNDKFINIKVDREERPDVDQLYMTAVQVMTQHGGWPMSVFLMPDLRPFWGGTYFPPADSHGRPGFGSLLHGIDDAYHNRHNDVEKSADQLSTILRQVAEPSPTQTRITIDDAFIDELIQRSTSDYEPIYGGFGRAPKFPRETLLELLLMRNAKPQSGQANEIAKMTRHALDAMANGGIRDHLGGGFHRYSTDAKWLVPHFEIMLYDNAMLAWCYAETSRQFNDARYARVARGILDFVLREMTAPSGAFYTAFDAEVDAQEGLSYLWTAEEIEQILGKEDAKIFNRIYGVDQGPNFADPHHGTGAPDKNILFLPKGPDGEDDPHVIEMRQKLYEARRKRKQPLLDTKVLTSWNALMIRALAHASKVLNEPRYLHAATTAADFLLQKHRKSDGGLFRTSRLDSQNSGSSAKLDGSLDDYAFLAHALMALHDVTAEPRWRDAAKELGTEITDRFHDPSGGGFYFTDRSATDLIVRQKTASDSPLPSGNAVAAMVMLDLGMPDIARRTIERFAQQMQAHGEGMSAMVQASLAYVQKRGPIVIEPKTESIQRPRSPQDLADSVVALGSRWINPQQLVISAAIEDGFHINAHRAEKDLVPTDLNIAGMARVNSIDYPPGDVYIGTVEFFVRFSKPVDQPLRATLRYQPCDESACLAPVSKRIEIPAP